MFVRINIIGIILFLVSFTFTFSLTAKEYNTEVSLDRNEPFVYEEINYKLKNIGLQNTVDQIIKENGFNAELFKTKTLEKNFTINEYYKFLESFFVKTEVILMLGADIKSDLAQSPSGVFKAEVNEQDFKNKFIAFTEDFDRYKEKNFYVDLDLNLQGSTNWNDLGVNSERIFTDSLKNSWRDLLISEFTNFKSVIFVEDKERKILENNQSIISPEAFKLKFTATIRKVYENKEIKKTSFEVEAHYVLVFAYNNGVVQSYEYPIQKKMLKNSNKKELSSTLASLIFNMLKLQVPSIKEAASKSKPGIDMVFSLKGQKLFSDIYNAQTVLKNYLIKAKAEITISKLNIQESMLSVSLSDRSIDSVKFIELLKNMGKLPLSNEMNEQKVLVYNPENNSFAITQKD